MSIDHDHPPPWYILAAGVALVVWAEGGALVLRLFGVPFLRRPPR